jgi:hypothetical protein
MSTGGTIAAVAGLGAVGVGGFLILRHMTAVAPGGGAVAALPTVGVSVTSPVPAVLQLANGALAISNAGCAAIAKSKGAPAALATIGCSAYTKYLTPLGLATTAVTLAEHLPIVGKPVRAAVNAVSTVVSKPINVAKNIVSSIGSWF